MLRTVKEFGAVGDGQADDSSAIAHAIAEQAGMLFFPPGVYRITKTLEINLAETGPFAVDGGGAARIVMAGAGPAFALLGGHKGTGSPDSYEEGVHEGQRMPLFRNIEIAGDHPEADGIWMKWTTQSTFEGVLLTRLRHGIHVQERARNILVNGCHIYDNSGVGIFFDDADLHQVVISASHISYNKRSGIKILNGSVRNVQITGNDIEYNYDRHDSGGAPPSAEIWFECQGDASIQEGSIASNTIQSRYSPGGANIMMIGKTDGAHDDIGMWAIAGNLLGSQETNVRLIGGRAITLSGNMIYSGHKRNLHATGSRNLVVSGNSFDHNQDYIPNALATAVTFEDCSNCNFTANTIQDAEAGKHTANTPVEMQREGLLELLGCERFTVSGCQLLDGAPFGLFAQDCSYTNVTGCTIMDGREQKLMEAAVAWRGTGKGNQLAANIIGLGTAKSLDLAEGAGVHAQQNLTMQE